MISELEYEAAEDRLELIKAIKIAAFKKLQDETELLTVRLITEIRTKAGPVIEEDTTFDALHKSMLDWEKEGLKCLDDALHDLFDSAEISAEVTRDEYEDDESAKHKRQESTLYGLRAAI